MFYSEEYLACIQRSASVSRLQGSLGGLQPVPAEMYMAALEHCNIARRQTVNIRICSIDH